MPELGPTHARLAAFEGSWIGKERLAPSPWSPGGDAHASLTFTTAAGGFAIPHDYRSDTGLTGHGVFSVAGEEVLWHWFDSIGFPPDVPARGGFDGDALVLERSSPRGTNTTTFTLSGDTLTQRVELDGGVLVEAEYRRRES
jgi:hypothetical protein